MVTFNSVQWVFLILGHCFFTTHYLFQNGIVLLHFNLESLVVRTSHVIRLKRLSVEIKIHISHHQVNWTIVSIFLFNLVQLKTLLLVLRLPFCDFVELGSHFFLSSWIRWLWVFLVALVYVIPKDRHLLTIYFNVKLLSEPIWNVFALDVFNSWIFFIEDLTPNLL